VRIYLVGAGGFAREVIDIIEALAKAGTDVAVGAIHADGGSDADELAARGYSVTGPVDAIADPGPDDRFVIGFGDSAARERADALLSARGWEAATLVHPAASLGSAVTLGAGTVICAGARLTTNITAGRHVHVNLNSTIGHDVALADYVTVNPLVSISGRVTVGARSTLGTGANINERLAIGSDSTVGAGAVVVRDVESNTTVAGVPAKPLARRDG
jgi:sugar O-acyltransferase (sialic acid O-acetyltransferase NeuD family)